MHRHGYNPPELMAPRNYSHALGVEGARRYVFVSGQVAANREGVVQAPGDLRAQTRLALENLRTALRAAGADTTDIVKLTLFVVGLRPGDGAAIREIRQEYLCRDPAPAVTLIGVEALVFEGLRIEIEAIAALD
jgi:enamine deaminase RidA (YjgF/YER057c/UK114 family)